MNWIERRIKEAYDNRLSTLDLGHGFHFRNKDNPDFLTEFPKDILKLTELTKLNLSGHSLKTLPPEISKLENLRELSLGQNPLETLPDEICELPITHLSLQGVITVLEFDYSKLSALTVLDLSFTSFKSLPTGILKLQNLIDLSLYYGHLTEFPKGLTRLRRLQTLAVGSEEMHYSQGDLERFSGNATLKHLKLCDVLSIDTLNEISQLKSLESIDVRDSIIERIPEGWFGLPELRGLDLQYRPSYGNGVKQIYKLANLTEIHRLSNLTSLTLENFSIIDSLSAISKLHGLKHLHLMYPDLAEYPSFISSFHQLESLGLVQNSFDQIPKSIANLKALTNLNLSGPLTSLPEEIGDLQELTFLWLAHTKLTELPRSFTRLRNLKTLSLHSAKFGCWPTELFSLSALETLVLAKTGVRDIPPSISNLNHLDMLDLSDNNLNEIPANINSLPRLRHLEISNIPTIESPPPEIVQRGTAVIQDYFSALSDSEITKLYEAKLIFVGEGEVGKTSLAYKVVDPHLDVMNSSIETTRGIGITTWQISTDFTTDFKVNVWDFGGQEIYHATHQFFLTKRSLYIFVWDARKEDRVGGFDYWLNVVQLLSSGSPIFIVLNKADIRIKEIDQAGLKTKFGNIIGFHKVSAWTGLGIAGLAEDIKANIAKLPHVGSDWPSSWSRVRTILENDKRDYIDYQEFLGICSGEGIDSVRADLLSSYLHDLGVILHFQEDPLLQKIIILKPEWGTNATYAVLDSKKVQQNNGKFSTTDLKEIWGNTIYPMSRHAELRQLMIKFELCFQVGNTSDYIAPELLSLTPPDFRWESRTSLRFEYHYGFMPAGIITRFIARNHTWIEGNAYWRNGAVLAWEDSEALVVCDPLRKVMSVSVLGKHKKDLLASIRRDFADIHKSLNSLDVRQMIPCVCPICTENDPFFFEFERLRKYFDGDLRTIVCDNSLQQVSIQQLLDGIFTPTEINRTKEMDSRVIHAEVYIERMDADMAKKQLGEPLRSNPWLSGSFYLVAGVVLIGLLATVAGILNLWGLAANYRRRSVIVACYRCIPA